MKTRTTNIFKEQRCAGFISVVGRISEKRGGYTGDKGKDFGQPELDAFLNHLNHARMWAFANHEKSLLIGAGGGISHWDKVQG